MVAPFSRELFAFLCELRENNDRDWFKANKARYEAAVQEPALTFIEDFGPRLAEISPHFLADPRTVGGSLFRIHRDTRFSNDKSPYKTNTGIQFRHEAGKDVHAPSFYVHLEPRSVFAGAGVWHPDSEALAAIRSAIVEKPEDWIEAVRASTADGRLELAGDSLKRAPAGYDPEHPLIDDLKRKDFVLMARLREGSVTSPRFADELSGLFEEAAPTVRFLCRAVGVPF